MLFTLFTRVQHLADIHLVNFDATVLRELLRHSIAWHKEVDTWICNGNLLRGTVRCQGPLVMPQQHAFAWADSVRMQPPGVNVVYVLANRENTAFYVGSTNDMAHRIRMHNGGRVLRTRNHRDWRFVFVVIAFDVGRPGLRNALLFEHQIKNRRAYRNTREDFYHLLLAVIAEWRNNERGNLEILDYA